MASRLMARLLAIVIAVFLTLIGGGFPVLAQTSLLSDEEVPQVLGISLGVETGITSRNVVEENVAFTGFTVSGDAVSTRLLAKVGLRFFDRIEIYGKAGGADLSISEFNNYDSTPAPAYGGGIRLDLYQGSRPERIKIFLDSSFLYFATEDTIQILDCPTSSCPNGAGILPRMSDEKIIWREGAISAGGSFRHDYFEPYGGVRLSFVRGDDKLDIKADKNFPTPLALKVDLNEDNNFGIFFGTNIYLDRNEKSALSLEISAVDQFAFTAGFKVNF